MHTMHTSLSEGNQERMMGTEFAVDNEAENDDVFMTMTDDEWLALAELPEHEPEDSFTVVTPSQEHSLTGTDVRYSLMCCYN